VGLEQRVTGQSGQDRLSIELVQVRNLGSFSALQCSLSMTICSIDLKSEHKGRITRK
jgi:hypothetical protein